MLPITSVHPPFKAMAQDDLEFSSLFDRDVESKENGPPEEGGGAKTDDDSSEEVGVVKPEPEGDKQDEGGATKEQDDDITENGEKWCFCVCFSR